MPKLLAFLFVFAAIPAFAQQPASGENPDNAPPMHVGGSVRPPTALNSVAPGFTDDARKAKFEGTVRLYLWIDKNGLPSHIRVIRGVGMGLDEKAVEAAQQYRFKPATRKGKPVKVDLYIDVNFQLR